MSEQVLHGCTEIHFTLCKFCDGLVENPGIVCDECMVELEHFASAFVVGSHNDEDYDDYEHLAKEAYLFAQDMLKEHIKVQRGLD